MGWQELLLIIIVVVLFVRPSDLPSLLKSFGRLVREIKSYTRYLTEEIERTEHNLSIMNNEKNAFPDERKTPRKKRKK